MREERCSPSAHPPFVALLRRLQAGDDDAWEPIERLCMPLVRRWCCRAHLTCADTEDVIQDVCVVLVSPGHVPDERGIRGWLWGITRHKIADSRRRHQRERSGIMNFDVCMAPPANPTESEAGDPCVDAVVAAARSALDQRTWQAFEQTALQGRRTKQVAWDLDMTANAVHLARRRVVDWLQRHRPERPADNQR